MMIDLLAEPLFTLAVILAIPLYFYFKETGE